MFYYRSITGHRHIINPYTSLSSVPHKRTLPANSLRRATNWRVLGRKSPRLRRWYSSQGRRENSSKGNTCSGWNTRKSLRYDEERFLKDRILACIHSRWSRWDAIKRVQELNPRDLQVPPRRYSNCAFLGHHAHGHSQAYQALYEESRQNPC